MTFFYTKFSGRSDFKTFLIRELLLLLLISNDTFSAGCQTGYIDLVIWEVAITPPLTLIVKL